MQTEETPTYTDIDDIPFLAVSFPVQGRQLPADHGYLLYAAITKYVPSGLVYSLIGHRIGYSHSQEVSRCKHRRFP
jgi:hypothetical protein